MYLRTRALFLFLPAFLCLLLSGPVRGGVPLMDGTARLAEALTRAAAELQAGRYVEDAEGPGVLETFSGTGADSVMSRLVAFQNVVDGALQTLAAASGERIAGAADPDRLVASLATINDLAADTQALSIRLVTRFRELLVRLMLDGRYAAADSPIRTAHELRLRQGMAQLAAKAQALTDAIDAATADLQTAAAPRLVLALEALETENGALPGRLPLAQDTQVTVHVRVRNRSDAPLAGIRLQLAVETAEGRTARIVSGDGTIALDPLAADDGRDGGGADETVVAWTIALHAPGGEPDALLRIEATGPDGMPPADLHANALLVPLLPDPLARDRDRDGLPDDWERRHGLNPVLADADADPDGDGLENAREFALGTDPRRADSDGDGLNDADELFGRRGMRTDPLTADTDGDGTDDLADGDPLDAGGVTGEALPAEPAVAVDTREVILDTGRHTVQVQVTNGGDGVLTWTAEIDDDLVADLSPAPGGLVTGDGTLEIRWPDPEHDFATTAGILAIVRVHDATGGRHDVQEIRVCHRTCEETLRRQPPAPFALVAPEDGATGLPTDLQFVWKRSRDPNGDPIQYQVLLCTDPEFTECTARSFIPDSEAAPAAPALQGIAGVLGGTALLGGLFGARRGRWRIHGLVLVSLLAAGTLLACSGGSGPGSDAPLSGILPGTDEEALTVTGLAEGTTYYWQVIADDGNGGTAASETRSFTTR